MNFWWAPQARQEKDRFAAGSSNLFGQDNGCTCRQTWEMAANVDLRLRKRINLESKLQTRGFANDILIAASARELGAVILTENSADFSIIASVLDIRFTQPEEAFEMA